MSGSRMRWVGHVASKRERIGTYKVLVGRPEGRKHLQDPGIDGRVMLKWIIKKWNGTWNGLICLKIGTGEGLL